jgi:mannose-6-phosphate isomerase-like protein (cupin superfamily)
MGYVFDQETLPKLVAAKPGRERIFFVSPQLAEHRDFLCGVLRYDDGKGKSPYHFHTGCEHFYLLLEGRAMLRTENEMRPLQAGQLVFIPDGDHHQIVAEEGSPLAFMEFQVPNQFKTTILEGDADDLRWFNEDGSVWTQT